MKDANNLTQREVATLLRSSSDVVAKLLAAHPCGHTYGEMGKRLKFTQEDVEFLRVKLREHRSRPIRTPGPPEGYYTTRGLVRFLGIPLITYRLWLSKGLVPHPSRLTDYYHKVYSTNDAERIRLKIEKLRQPPEGYTAVGLLAAELNTYTKRITTVAKQLNIRGKRIGAGYYYTAAQAERIRRVIIDVPQGVCVTRLAEMMGINKSSLFYLVLKHGLGAVNGGKPGSMMRSSFSSASSGMPSLLPTWAGQGKSDFQPLLTLGLWGA